MDNTLEHVLFLARRFNKSNFRHAVIILLMELGVPTQYDGFDYLVKAIVAYIQDPAQVMMNGLYFVVAQQYDWEIDIRRIEQAIRSAIDFAWKNGRPEAWDRYYLAGQQRGVKRPANIKLSPGLLGRLNCGQRAVKLTSRRL